VNPYVLILLVSILTKSAFATNVLYAIDKQDKSVFPDRSHKNTSVVETYRQSGTLQSSKSKNSAMAEFAFDQQISFNGSNLKIMWKPKFFTQNMTRAGKQFKFSDTTLLPSAKLSATVNCKTKKVTEKSGFQEAISKIEKVKPPGEERDYLTSSLSALIDSASEACGGGAGGLIDLHKVVGKKPGYKWTEAVPMPGQANAKTNIEFLGWHKKEEQKFAVLHGRFDSIRRITQGGQNLPLHVSIEQFVLVSSDRRKILKDITVEQVAAGSREHAMSGKIKTNATTEIVSWQ